MLRGGVWRYIGDTARGGKGEEAIEVDGRRDYFASFPLVTVSQSAVPLGPLRQRKGL